MTPDFGRETEYVEYKKSLTEAQDGYVALVAMLNKHCKGKVIFGVKDDGTAVGVDIGKNTLRSISQDISNFIEPRLIPQIEVVEPKEGVRCISVSVEGNDRPYSKSGSYYIRSGEENKIIPRIELRRMFQSFTDLLMDAPSFIKDLTFDELIGMMRARGLHVEDIENVLRRQRLIRPDGSFNMVAELVSDQNPFVLSVSIFSGIDRREVKRTTDFSGHSIMKEMQSVLDYLEAINDTEVDMSSLVRKDTKLFDIGSFREAWVNAVVHNTWMLGIAPAVHVFDDRLEVISYGSIPYGQSDEDFFRGVSMPVNESLMQIFRGLGLSEHTGHGVPVIVESCGRDAFDISGSNIRVTIPFHRRRSLSAGQSKEALSEKERLILSILMTEPTLTLSKVSEIGNIGVSNTRAIVSALQTKGYLVREGSRKKGSWKVLIDRIEADEVE